MKNKKILLGLLIAITFLAFLPSLGNKFTNWDDDFYVVNNSVIREFSLQNTVKIFTASYSENYLPLTILSYNIEYNLFKLDPFIYHLDNLLLHLLNCVLVFYLIFLLCGSSRIAFVTALLFGIHPLHVESVAWVAERKDVLYALFFLLALIFYIKYQRSSRTGYLYLALTGFVFSCLSKAMAFTFPFVLLLFDYYLNRKYEKKILLEKIPFFVLAFIFGSLGFLMQKAYGAVNIERLSNTADNLLKAVYNLGFYLYKLLIPVNLSNVYSYPMTLYGMLAAIMLFLLAGAAVCYVKNKTVNFCAFFFLITIFPVLQLIPLGVGVPADRYTYIPAIGIFFLAGAGLEKLYGKLESEHAKRRLLSYGVSVVFILLSSLTFLRCFAWYDGESIWKDALKKDNNSRIAVYHLAVLSFGKGDYEKALKGFTKAIEFDPGFNLAYNQRALVYIHLGEFNRARADIARIKKNNPKAGESCLKLYELCDRMEAKEKKGINRKESLIIEDALSCLAKGNYDAAIKAYTDALVLNPENPEYLNNRGVALSAINDNLNALKDFNAAVKAMKDNALPEYYFNRGNIFRKLGEHNEAIADYSRALQKEKGKAEYYNNRGISYYNLKDYKLALNDFEQAILINPENKSAVKNRDILIQKSNKGK
ncbi:MAG: tetratricopeptide repeat protein [Candidatus Firestonebacteria bacterium]